ncbi:hypothetical protein EHS25_010275 [Saitozyma podzolica]|uniref:chitin deacetylase n=1 Tax=Saitozyma podzolica TaxID=1890683 RepID=A0A427YJ49_9TREE|nr:hypothetical protein EHS25_010275 [Saitozyma podzolica]
MFADAIITLLITLASVSAAPAFEPRWQPADSHVADLFKRGGSDPSDPNWASSYPASGATPPSSSIPAAWLSKLASISLPNVQPSTQNNGYPTYANGESGADSTICSFTYGCTTSDDLFNPPAGVLALTFDDGPAAGSDQLYTFLEQNGASAKATHFMIGGSILGNPSMMQRAFGDGGLIAVHTWSHPYNHLGPHGGRLPLYWRPPFGDVDNRVRAIAKGVFGLETVPWNQDSADWAIGNNPAYTISGVEASMDGWLTGSKSPGLCILEHELNNNTVGVFMAEYPKMVSNGWDVKTVADAWSMDWYQNADSNTDTVTSMSIAGGSAASTNASSSVSASASSSASASASSSTSASVSSTSSVSDVTSPTSVSIAAASGSAKAAASVSAAAAAQSSKSAANPLVTVSGWATVLGLVAALVV